MNIIIGNAWPYANGPLHLGRIAVLLPGDILARYHRMMGDEVIFLSGTDCHGTPVTIKAKEEGIMPIQAVKKYHAEFQKCFKSLGFSFDIFEKTHSKFHEEKVKEFILELYNKGYIYEKNVEQAYCEKCNEYLADRYIVGKCPHCGEEATGDDCENCNGEFEINELLDIRCKICNSRPVLKETKHLFFALSKFEEDVKRVYENQDGWRENAKRILKRYLDEGLRDRTVTRDFNWGVDVPLDGYEDKKIFVWIEAVMGYLTASMKCLKERGEDYRDYWEGEDSRIYFIHGKDNIPFHTVIFPAILSGLGIKNPNLRLISGEHLKLEGKPFSTVKNWAIWADYVCKRYNVDSFRYYLALNSPEDKDTDFTWREYINIHNSDLINELSNFVNKVLSFSRKNYANRIPKGNIEENLKNEILNYLKEEGMEVKDFGTYTEEACDYADISLPVAEAVAAKEFDFGILICGTGIGIGIAANKVPGIRAALCSDTFSAHATREHNDANILTMGERVVGKGLAIDIVKTFLSAEFQGGRHATRIAKITDIEKKYSK